MKRKDLLNVALNKDENSKVLIDNTAKVDIKFLKRAIRNLTDELEDAESEVERRLSSEVQIDNSTVEVAYGKTITLKSKIALYENFLNKYYEAN